MSNTTVTISTDLLSPHLAERFETLFAVASRKTLRAWELADADTADVVLLDDSQASELADTGAACVICVGYVASTEAQTAQWAARLNKHFTVGDLMDVLDRAGVFLMDLHIRQKTALARQQLRLSTLQAPLSQAGSEPASAVYRYRLQRWVSLDAPLDTPACHRALALLTREAVTLRQLCHHSGLDLNAARMLLVQLGRRGVIVAEAQQVARPAAVSAPVQEPRASMPFLQRLTQWVLAGGRA